jgi:hypothetical protein
VATRTRRLGAAAFVVWLLVAGAAGASPATTPKGWKSHIANNKAFTVAAPATWVDFTRASGEALKAIKVDPKLRPYLDYVRKNKSIKLLLLDVSGTQASFAANLNIVQVRVPVSDLELLRDASVAQLKSLGVLRSPIKSSFVRLPAGRALKLTYHARFAPNPVVAQTQFALLKNQIETVLTYTALPRNERHYRPIFEISARTFTYR